MNQYQRIIIRLVHRIEVLPITAAVLQTTPDSTGGQIQLLFLEAIKTLVLRDRRTEQFPHLQLTEGNNNSQIMRKTWMLIKTPMMAAYGVNRMSSQNNHSDREGSL